MFNNKQLSRRLQTSFYRIDKLILLIVYTLVIIGTIFIYSATKDNPATRSIIIKHVFWVILGTIIMIIIMFYDYRKLKSKALLFNLISIGLLLIVRFAGKTTLGAQRWIKLGPFTIQPSEFVKVAVIIILASFITKKFKDGINSIGDIITVFIPVSIISVLILIQPDLGTTLAIVFIFLTMIFLYGANMKSLIFLGLIALVLALPVYMFGFKDYQKKRVTTFLHPEQDTKGDGWHIIQSKISIGAGGLTGTGIFKGSQSRLSFLPEAQTDFIFSIISEELGFVGSAGVIILYFLLIFFILRPCKFIEDDFGKLILYGVASVFFFHLIVNVGMTMGMMPVTGKPLLFLSYGGSSYMSAFALIGLVQSIKIHID
ncbi:MAG: rod shape-determining protein RodA [Sebaldella sp.]|nr:rod shape-determining protein RodA [Sebaldella sp.]